MFHFKFNVVVYREQIPRNLTVLIFMNLTVLLLVEFAPHHFVFVTLEADDTALVALSIRTGLATGVLQLQDISIPCRPRLNLPEAHIFISNLHTGCCTGGTVP